MNDTGGQYQCTLLGTVDIVQSMRLLESHQRLRMAKIAHKAIYLKDIEDSDRSWLQNPETYYNTKVNLKIDSTSRGLMLYDGKTLMSQHPIATISVMVTLDGCEGHLVYIGQCSKANRRLAVVLAFSSLKDANSMVKMFETVKGQDPSGVNIVSSNAIGRQPSFSSPPPIPTAPKPSSSTLPPLPPKPSNTNVIEGNVSDTDSEESYVNEEEEKEEKEEDEEEEEEEEGEGGEEKEDEGEDEKEDTYINDEPSKKASPYQNAGPSRGVQPSLPPRNTQDKKRISQSPKQTIATPQPATPQPKHKKEGFFKNILGKGDKTKKKYPSEDTRAIPNISETQPPQTNIRPLPVPRNRLPNSNQTSNTPSSDTVNSQSSNPPQTSDSDDDDDIYVNDTFYEKIGLDTKDQERIYMKISPNNEESTAGTRPITNVVDYMLDNEQKYITTVNKLADGKKFFPLVIQPYLGSIEKLPALHKELYEALTASKKSTAKMATAFISRKEKFIVYHNIIVNALVVEKHLKNTSDYEKAKIKDMHEPLRQARKRLHFYFMHLEGMLPSATEQERKKIQEAVDILKDYYKNADTGVLIKSIRKSPLQLTLYKPLHLHSLVYVSGPQMNNKEYRVLLFEEIIIVALPIDDDHEYQLDIRMEVVKLNDNTTNPKTLILHVDYGGVRGMEKYIFRFTDEKVKQGWKNEILSIHRRYMEKIRGSTTS